MNRLGYIIIILLVLACPALSLAEACPVSVLYPDSSTTLIEAPGGAKFKIEKQLVKTLLPAAFDKHKWTQLKLTKGAGKITGYLKSAKGEKVVSVFIALQRGATADWFLTVNEDVSGASGQWLVVSSVNNVISCSKSTSLEAASIEDSYLKPHGLKSTSLKVLSADYVYGRLGL